MVNHWKEIAEHLLVLYINQIFVLHNIDDVQDRFGSVRFSSVIITGDLCLAIDTATLPNITTTDIITPSKNIEVG